MVNQKLTLKGLYIGLFLASMAICILLDVVFNVNMFFENNNAYNISLFGFLCAISILYLGGALINKISNNRLKYNKHLEMKFVIILVAAFSIITYVIIYYLIYLVEYYTYTVVTNIVAINIIDNVVNFLIYAFISFMFVVIFKKYIIKNKYNKNTI